MRQLFKDFLSFSGPEFRVVISISFLIIALLSVRYLLYTPDRDPERVPPEMQAEITEFIASFEPVEEPGVQPAQTQEKIHPLLSPRFFDPNKASLEELRKIGLSERVSSNIIAYREAGGSFRKKEDLRKIYGLTHNEFVILRPYIRISGPREKVKDSRYRSVAMNNSPEMLKKDIEINTANADELMSIRGIGEVYSKRIIKYRDLLGGFLSPDQLAEVYGITDSMVRSWGEIITIDSSRIRTLSVNNSEYSAFLRHPYINRKQVEGIMKLRSWLEEEMDPGDLQKYGILTDSLFEKVEAYLVR